MLFDENTRFDFIDNTSQTWRIVLNEENPFSAQNLSRFPIGTSVLYEDWWEYIFQVYLTANNRSATRSKHTRMQWWPFQNKYLLKSIMYSYILPCFTYFKLQAYSQIYRYQVRQVELFYFFVFNDITPIEWCFVSVITLSTELFPFVINISSLTTVSLATRKAPCVV